MFDDDEGDASVGKAKIPDGAPEQVETKYYNDWETFDQETPNHDFTAKPSEPVPTLEIEFSSEDDPWMREHALMVKDGLDQLGFDTELVDRPLNQLYADWTPAGLGFPVSMSTHGPDPQRGLDPNPLLMRRHKDNLSNYSNYWNDEVTQLLSDQRELTNDAEKRAALAKEAQALMSDDVMDIITIFPDVITAANTENWSGYVPTPGNGATRDSFQWTEVNIQPETDSRSYVKGVSNSMNSKNLAWSSGGPEEKRLKFVYDGLFDASPTLEIVPALATSAEFVDDTTVEMELRDGVTWHDGESFGPDDVKFTVELFKEYSSPSQSTFYDPIESVDIVSESGGGVVQFNLSRPDASFLTQRVVRSVILPKHKWENVDNPAQHNPETPIGTGPFSFVDWDQGTRFVVERNDDHWMWDDDWRNDVLGEHAASGPGVEEVVWVNVGNVDSMIGALQQGEIDAIDATLSNSQADRAANTDGVEKLVADNFAPLDCKIDHTVPLIRDKEFRVAFAKSVDKQGFTDDVLGGRATVSKGQNPLSPLLEQWHNDDIEAFGFNLDEARSILERAGYQWDGDGQIHWPNGDAWTSFVERVDDGHQRREALGQPNFS